MLPKLSDTYKSVIYREIEMTIFYAALFIALGIAVVATTCYLYTPEDDESDDFDYIIASSSSDDEDNDSEYSISLMVDSMEEDTVERRTNKARPEEPVLSDDDMGFDIV